MPRVTSEEVVTYVKASLGFPNVDIEVADAVIESHLQVALLFISPYYSGTVFLDKTVNSVIDLRDEEVEEVVSVFETVPYDSNDFGFSPLLRFSQNPIQRAVDTYTFSDNVGAVGKNFKFVDGRLYLYGYSSSSVSIECLKALNDITELRDPVMLSWVFKYTLALTKKTMGAIRRKFNISSNPIQLDGDSLASEGESECQDLESQIRDGSLGIFFVVR